MTFRTGPVGGWNGCPDPRIVAGLTRGEGHGARLTMGGRQLIEFLHPQGLSLRTIAAQVGASASTVKRLFAFWGVGGGVGMGSGPAR